MLTIIVVNSPEYRERFPRVFDEPEDHPYEFVRAESVPVLFDLLHYWNIQKAVACGLWAPYATVALAFNWYPCERRFLSWWQRPFYVFWKCLEYRVRYSIGQPVWAVLGEFEGMDERGAAYYKPGRLMAWWIRVSWRVGVWPHQAGWLVFRG